MPLCRSGEDGYLTARSAAYTLVQFVYEHMAAEDVKSRILGPAGGDQVSYVSVTALLDNLRIPHTCFP